MKAVIFDKYGDPDVLHVGDVAEPHAGPGQVRVAVRAASVNPIDWKLRSGALQGMMDVELPAVVGYDGAGVVDEVGEGADAAVGDEVFGFGADSATAAEYAVFDDFARKPEGLSWEEAGGYPVAVETSVRALELLGLTPGQTVLINGAAGGVGAAAVQIAIARGGRVIGTASTGNHDFLRQLGAEPTTYGEGLVERVRALGGADLALDTAGSGAIPDLVEITGDPGTVITIADYSAPQYGVRVTGGQDGRYAQALGEAAKLWEEGKLSVPVAQAFPFAQAAEAHRLSAGGHVRGKLVLTPE
jgi:NADPH:quinone reductase-like Zn-dependent oxidoreductase